VSSIQTQTSKPVGLGAGDDVGGEHLDALVEGRHLEHDVGRRELDRFADVPADEGVERRAGRDVGGQLAERGDRRGVERHHDRRVGAAELGDLVGEDARRALRPGEVGLVGVGALDLDLDVEHVVGERLGDGAERLDRKSSGE
jgi:hypothetical protein